MDINTKDILTFQNAWAKAIVDIGVSFRAGGNYVALASNLVNDMYGYNEGPVLFKPTKAKALPFRARKEEAISYFVGGDVAEDTGFALTPWAKITWDQPQFALPHLVMGNYTMHPYGNDATSVLAEYSMGFFRTEDGILKLNLHHSSLPFSA